MNDISGLASEICDNRYAVYLEGGYNLHALAEIVGSSIGHSMEQEPKLAFTEMADQDIHAASYLEEVIAVQSKYWQL